MEQCAARADMAVFLDQSRLLSLTQVCKVVSTSRICSLLACREWDGRLAEKFGDLYCRDKVFVQRWKGWILGAPLPVVLQQLARRLNASPTRPLVHLEAHQDSNPDLTRRRGRKPLDETLVLRQTHGQPCPHDCTGRVFTHGCDKYSATDQKAAKKWLQQFALHCRQCYDRGQHVFELIGRKKDKLRGCPTQFVFDTSNFNAAASSDLRGINIHNCFRHPGVCSSG